MKKLVFVIFPLLVLALTNCERREANNPLDPGNSTPPEVSLIWPDQNADTIGFFPVISEISGSIADMEMDVLLKAYLLTAFNDTLLLDTLLLAESRVDPGAFSVPFVLPDSLVDPINENPQKKLVLHFEDADANATWFSFEISNLATVVPQIVSVFPTDHFFVFEQSDNLYSELPLEAIVSYHPALELVLTKVEFVLTAVNFEGVDLVWQNEIGESGDFSIESIALPGEQPTFGSYLDSAYVFSVRAIDSANNVTTHNPSSLSFPDSPVMIYVGDPEDELTILSPSTGSFIGRYFELVFFDRNEACPDDDGHDHLLILDTMIGTPDTVQLVYDASNILQNHLIQITDKTTTTLNLALIRNCEPVDTAEVRGVLVDQIPPELLFEEGDTLFLSGPTNLIFSVIEEQSGLNPLGCNASVLYPGVPYPVAYNAYFPDLTDSILVVEFVYNEQTDAGLKALLRIEFSDMVENAVTVDVPFKYRTAPPEVLSTCMDDENHTLHLELESSFIPVCVDSVYAAFDIIPTAFLMAHVSSTDSSEWFSINPSEHYVSGDSVEVTFAFQDVAGNVGEYVDYFDIETIDFGELITSYGPIEGSYTNADSIWFEIHSESSGLYYELVINDVNYVSGETEETLLVFTGLGDDLEVVNSVRFSATAGDVTDVLTFWFVYDVIPPNLHCTIDDMEIFVGDTISLGRNPLTVEFYVTDAIDIPVLGDTLLMIECEGLVGSPLWFTRTVDESVECVLEALPGYEDTVLRLRTFCFDRAGNSSHYGYELEILGELTLIIDQLHDATTERWYTTENDLGWVHHIIQDTYTHGDTVWFGAPFINDSLRFTYDPDVSNLYENIYVNDVIPDGLIYDTGNNTATLENFILNFPGGNGLKLDFRDEETGRMISDSTTFGCDVSTLTAGFFDVPNGDPIDAVTFAGEYGQWIPSRFHLRILDPYHFVGDALSLEWVTESDTTVHFNILNEGIIEEDGSSITYEFILPASFAEDNPDLTDGGEFLLIYSFQDNLMNEGSDSLLCQYVNLEH